MSRREVRAARSNPALKRFRGGGVLHRRDDPMQSARRRHRRVGVQKYGDNSFSNPARRAMRVSTPVGEIEGPWSRIQSRFSDIVMQFRELNTRFKLCHRFPHD